MTGTGSQDNLLAFCRSYGGDAHTLTKTWETFKVTQENRVSVERLQAVEWFKKPGAFIHGPTGAGKSHAMKALFNQGLLWRVQMHEQGYQIDKRMYWVSMSFYLDELRSSDFGQGSATKKKCLNATTLFVDDLGASTKTDWALDQIFQLIDYRAEREMQTFITSNWNLDELGKNYSIRIASRIASMCVVVPMFCQDHRVKVELKENTATVLSRIKTTTAQRKE